LAPLRLCENQAVSRKAAKPQSDAKKKQRAEVLVAAAIGLRERCEDEIEWLRFSPWWNRLIVPLEIRIQPEVRSTFP
jgi:hypothetical protein